MYLDNGNLAHQYTPDDKEKLAIKKKNELQVRQKNRQKMLLKRKMRARTLVMILTMLSMAFLFVYGEVRQYEMATAVENATQKLSQIEDEKNRAILNIEKTTDLTSIENIATTQLGMSKATQDQVVYLDLEKKDRVQTSQENNNIMHHALTKGERLVGEITEKIRNIFSI